MNFTFLLFYSLSIFSNIEEPPPGTIKVKNYYVDYTEIGNIHWLEYIHYAGERMDSTEIKSLLPDNSNTWYELPANRYKPIVLISYDQAVGYCKWRSKVVSELKNRKIVYRLPTKEEWIDIAKEVWKQDYRKNKRDIEDTIEGLKANPNDHFTSRKPDNQLIARNPEKERVYDLFSNVSEMTQQYGVAIGQNNSMLSTDEDDLIKFFHYDSMNYMVGFRCIAEYQD